MYASTHAATQWALGPCTHGCIGWHAVLLNGMVVRYAVCSYKRVKGSSHSVEERISLCTQPDSWTDARRSRALPVPALSSRMGSSCLTHRWRSTPGVDVWTENKVWRAHSEQTRRHWCPGHHIEASLASCETACLNHEKKIERAFLRNHTPRKQKRIMEAAPVPEPIAIAVSQDKHTADKRIRKLNVCEVFLL